MTSAKWLPFCTGVNMMRWVKIKIYHGQLELLSTFCLGSLMFIFFLQMYYLVLSVRNKLSTNILSTKLCSIACPD